MTEFQPGVHTAPLNVLLLRKEALQSEKKRLEREAADLAEQSMERNDQARALNADIAELVKAIEALTPKEK